MFQFKTFLCGGLAPMFLPSAMQLRWLVVLASWLASCVAYNPAPIHWGGLPAKKFFLGPGALPNTVSFQRNSWRPPQMLAIWDQSDKTSPDEIPHFIAKSDHTIAWESHGLCLEAHGVNQGDAVRVNRCTAGPMQLWNVLPSGRGRTSLIELQSTGKCLDVREDVGLLNGAPVALHECENKATALWDFAELVSNTTLFPAAASGVRYMVMSSVLLAMLAALGLSSWLWRRKARTLFRTQNDVPISARRAGVSMVAAYSFDGLPSGQADSFSRLSEASKYASDNSDASELRSEDLGGNSSGKVRELSTAAEVMEEMQGSTKARVVLFGQRRCQTCRLMEPKMHRLQKVYMEVRFARVNYSDKTKQAFTDNNITKTPRLALVEPGAEPRFIAGVEELKEDLQRMYPGIGEDRLKRPEKPANSTFQLTGENVQELQEAEDVRRQLQHRTTPAVLIFGQRRCRKCRSLEPQMRRIAESHLDVPFFVVIFNAATKEAFTESGVTSTPKFAVLEPDMVPRFVSIEELGEALDKMKGSSRPKDDESASASGDDASSASSGKRNLSFAYA